MSEVREVREFRQSRFTAPPGACQILLVRHGESMPTREGETVPTVDGHSDPALDPNGHAQAIRVADRLEHEGIERIYVTTLQRTRQTAAPLAERLGIEPLLEVGLREVHLGEWEGGPFRQRVADRHPIAVRMYAEQRWDVIPGAEPKDAFAARVREAITRVADANPDRTVACFTHGGVIGQVLADACGADRGFAFTGSDNGSISHLVVSPQRWVIRRYNDTAHLGLGFTTAPEPLT